MEKKRIPIPWPIGGRVDRYAIQNQPPNTTIAARNVWPDAQGRERGGSRPALIRRDPHADPEDRPAGPIATLATLTYFPPGSPMTTAIYVMSSSGGTFWSWTEDLPATSWTLIQANQTPFTFVTSAEHNQILYISDFSPNEGQSSSSHQLLQYDPGGSSSTVDVVAASVGAVPTGCRCVVNFRDRIALTGSADEPTGVFFSRQGDPTDWDYTAQDDGRAVNLTLAFAGGIAEPATAMWPHADNCLLIGCRNSLWMLIGDPVNGSLANLSQTIGILDLHSFCTTPDGAFVFLSADGLYLVPAGCGNPTPQSISREKLPEELLNLDPANMRVTLAYDVRWRGIFIFVTDMSRLAEFDEGCIHWFFDWESKSFWEMQFGGQTGARFDPISVLARKNFAAEKSVVLLLCRDGHLRSLDEGYDSDDGNSAAPQRFTSSCLFGPLGDSTLLDYTLWAQLEVILSRSTAEVEVEIFKGDTAEEAFAAVESGVPGFRVSLAGGRSRTLYPRVRGASLYLRLSATIAWAFEAAAAVLAKAGRVRL